MIRLESIEFAVRENIKVSSFIFFWMFVGFNKFGVATMLHDDRYHVFNFLC